jgi:hypothetical protein
MHKVCDCVVPHIDAVRDYVRTPRYQGNPADKHQVKSSEFFGDRQSAVTHSGGF